MIDLAALPVWVGTLISGYKFQPAEAGGLVTLFLVGVVVCSVALSPIFHKMDGRWLAPLGFWISAFCFLGMTQVDTFGALAILHVIAGVGTGIGISFTHGTMGKTTNPHRVFAMGSLGLGVVSVFYLGATPQLIDQSGPEMLFWVFVAVMGFAAIFNTLFFPRTLRAEEEKIPHTKFSKIVWFMILGIVFMSLNNAMILSFVERVGMDKGYGSDKVQMALIGMGILTIVPAILAAVFQSKLSPLKVAIVASVIHGMLAFAVMTSPSFPTYMAPLLFVPFVMIFAHTFVFGKLAASEPTGRAVAATPAVIMTGSAIGPFLGGVLVQTSGYAALGGAAFVIGIIGMVLFYLANIQDK